VDKKGTEEKKLYISLALLSNAKSWLISVLGDKYIDYTRIRLS
jgi:hypothetical protein